MEYVVALPNGKCRRRLSPEHALFAAGNALRVAKYYQLMGVATPHDNAVEWREERQDHDVFVCRLFNCQGVGFRSRRAYEEHYDLEHRNVCRECLRSFLSFRLLDLHISETHDAFFRVLAKRQPMYECLVDGCGLKFKHDDKRTKHLITDHQYPPTFTFHRPRRPRPTRETTKSEPMEDKDVDAIKIAKAHARKQKRREKKKQEARERKQGQQAIEHHDMEMSDAPQQATEDAVMQDDGDVGELVQRMTQLMVPRSISFGRRQNRR